MVNMVKTMINKQIINDCDERFENIVKKTLQKASESEHGSILDIAAKNWKWFECEKIYRIIYGTQIALLEELADGLPITIKDAQEFYHYALKKRHIKDFPPFFTWIKFLEKNNLIIRYAEKNPFFVLDDKGGAFLKYIKDNSYDLKRMSL